MYIPIHTYSTYLLQNDDFVIDDCKLEISFNFEKTDAVDAVSCEIFTRINKHICLVNVNK